MAEEQNTVIEKLELSLGYDEFISGLRNVTNAYHSALDKINNMGANMGKALVQSSRFVQNSINTLSTETANFIKNSFGNIQTQVDSAHDSIRKLSSQISKDLRDIEKLTEKKAAVKVKGEEKLAALESIITKNANISKAQAEILRTALAGETLAKIASIEAQIIEKTSKMYKGMTDLGLNAAQTITTVTQKTASSILAINKEAISELSKVYQTSGKFSADIEGMYSGKQTIDRIKTQREVLAKQLITIEQERVSAQKAVDLTLIAMNKQTNEAMHKDAVLAHAKTTNELNKVLETQKRAINYEKELGESLTAAYGRLPEILKSVKGNTDAASVAMKQDIGTIERAFDELFNHVTRSMSIFGKLGSGDIKKYFSMFTNFGSEIGKNISVIDEMVSGLKRIKNVDPGIRAQINDLTGLKDRFINLKKSIDDTIKTTEKLNFSGPLKQSQEVLSKFSTQFSRLFDEIRKEKRGFKGEDFSSQLGISQGLQHWKNIKSYSEEMRNLLKVIRKEITAQEQAQSQIEIEITRTDNETKKKLYKSYVDSVKQYIGELQARLEIYSKEFTGGRKLRDTLVANSEAFKESIKDQMSGWNNTIKTIDQMKRKYEEVRSYASKWGEANREAAQKGKDELHKQAEGYIEVKQRIQEAIRSLHTLAKSKDLNFNATETINELSKMLRTMNTTMPQIRSMMAGSTKFVDAQMRAASKSWTTLAWESVRNFRWQVAGILYLIDRAVVGVKNTLVNTFKEIDNYRKQVYALTGVVGMNIEPEMFKNQFHEIFLYSRNLMDQLQAESGKTYASLEDLVMVTRSFAQAGIFPKTQEDISKISTLATAVKVMTEGMANEGVQMRQEIMSLIEGRTRVTDTLAKMLQQHGINIKEAMAEWARTGKDKLTGFSELFASFAEVNKHIAGEYSVQIRKLETTWQWIKRIAAESLTLKVAEDIDKFTTSLGSLTEGNLTDLGERVMLGVRTGLAGTYEALKVIGGLLVDQFDQWSRIAVMINNVTTELGASSENLSPWAASMELFLQGLVVVTALAKMLIWPFKSVIQLISGGVGIWQAWYYAILGVKEAILSFWDDNNKSAEYFEKSLSTAKDSWKLILSPITDAYEDWQQYNNGLDQATNSAVAFEKQMQKVNETTKDAINTALTYSGAVTTSNKALAELEEIDKKYKSKKEKYGEDTKKVKDIVEANAQATKNAIAEIEAASVEANKKMTEDLSNQLQQNTTAVGSNIQNVSSAVVTAVGADVETAKGFWASFINFMSNTVLSMVGMSEQIVEQSASGVRKAIPGTEADKVQQEALKSNAQFNASMEAENARMINSNARRRDQQINNLVKKQQEVAERGAKVSNDIVEKGAGGTKKTLLDMYDEYMGLLDKFGSVDPFQKITYDYWKHLADIDKAAQENSIVREHYEELVGKAQQYWLDQLAQKRAEAEKNTVDFYRKITDLEASPIQKITEKFKDLVSEINANKNIAEPTKEWLKSLIPANEALAKQNQLRKDAIELEQKWLEVTEARAKYLDLSVNTFDKQAASVMRLEAEYKKWVLTQEEALRNAERLAQADPENYAEAYRQQREIFEESNYWMKQSLDEQLLEVWQPFYKDLKDMQQGWADSISSTLTDILFDTKDWKTKISDLFKSISKEIINAFIKRNIVEPFLNQFNDISKGGVLGKLFGTTTKKTEEGETTETSGWMGYVNKALNFFGLGSKSEERTKDMLGGYSYMNPLPVIVTNMSGGMGGAGEGGGGFLGSITGAFSSLFSGGESKNNDSISQTVNSLSNLSNSAVMTSSTFGEINASGDSLADSFISNASSIASAIASMISSMGSSGGGGGSLFSSIGSLFSSSGSSSFAMAEGGTIKEPIFGVGLKSGATYSLGEKEDEIVTPMSKVKPKGYDDLNQPVQTNTFVNFHINAIDSKTGTEFLIKNSETLQGVVSKAVKNNKSIRRDIKNSY